jgi:tRNA A-37 threonylcarbamoyl transferase component Bud32
MSAGSVLTKRALSVSDGSLRVRTPVANAHGSPEYIHHRIGEFDWHVLPQYRSLLFDDRGLRLPQWQDEGSAALIKAGAGRTIHRVRIPGADVYVKHFRATNIVSLVHQALRQGRARKEFEVANELAAVGVPTITPIALGERRKGGLLLESYLISESIADGMTLFDLIDRRLMTMGEPVDPALRFHLARELGVLAARIHDAGVEHRDLHERNIVVRSGAKGGLELFMLDLHELRRRPGGEWKWAERDLGRMGRYFTLRTTAADRRRFFRAYAAERGWQKTETRKRAKVLESGVIESRADFWRRRDQRGPAKYNRINEFRLFGVKAFAVPELPVEFVRRVMTNPDGVFKHVVAWWKQGRSTRVAAVDMPAIRHADPLVFKQYFFKGWHESLSTVMRPNQAERAWNHGAALLLRELPTPRPLMLVHKTVMGLPVTSYLLCERVPGAMGLVDYLESSLKAAPNRKEHRRIIEGVLDETARLLRMLHDRRVTHRDLKASNVLAEPSGDPAKPKLWLIDLDGVTTWKTVPERHRVQNLARINVSFWRCDWLTLADRLRFLRLYMGRDFYNRPERKRFWRAIAADTTAKIERNQRRGRTIL